VLEDSEGDMAGDKAKKCIAWVIRYWMMGGHKEGEQQAREALADLNALEAELDEARAKLGAAHGAWEEACRERDAVWVENARLQKLIAATGEQNRVDALDGHAALEECNNEIVRLRKALEWYANETANYRRRIERRECIPLSPILVDDGGKRARDVLGEELKPCESCHRDEDDRPPIDSDDK
jgi:hypothetical protein